MINLSLPFSVGDNMCFFFALSIGLFFVVINVRHVEIKMKPFNEKLIETIIENRKELETLKIKENVI